MKFAEFELSSIYAKTNPTPVNKHRSDFSKRSVLGKCGYSITTIIVWLGALIMFFPFFWMFSTALKTDAEITSMTFTLWSNTPEWDGFGALFDKSSIYSASTTFGRAILNTLIVELCVLPIGTFTSTLAAFAFAKMKFRFKKTLLIVLMTAMMVPYCSIMYPQFQMFQELGVIDSLFPLIIPGLFSKISMIFFVTAYMKNAIPDSLIEAAKIDGASFFRMYWQLAVPLAKSAIAAQVIFWFVGIWNDYFAPSFYISANSEWKTIQVWLFNLWDGAAGVNGMDVMMAGSFVSAIPMIIFFLIFRNMFVQTTALSGVKE